MRRVAIGHDVADLDLGIARADIVFLLSMSVGRKHCGGGKRSKRNQACRGSQHSSLPIDYCFVVLEVSQAASALASAAFVQPFSAARNGIVADGQVWLMQTSKGGTDLVRKRTGPRHPGLGEVGFRVGR